METNLLGLHLATGNIQKVGRILVCLVAERPLGGQWKAYMHQLSERAWWFCWQGAFTASIPGLGRDTETERGEAVANISAVPL